MDLEAFLPYIAGAVAIPVINFAKEKLNLAGRWVIALSVVLSAALAYVAVVLFGDGFNLEEDLTKAFAAATIIYKLL